MSETDYKYTFERNIAGFFIIIMVVLLRLILFPRVLTELNVVYVSDAMFLILAGWFLGRINLLSDKIEAVVFQNLWKKGTLNGL